MVSILLLNLDIISALIAIVFSLQIRPPSPLILEGSLTLYILFWLILALHLLILQATTRLLVPSDALPSLL